MGDALGEVAGLGLGEGVGGVCCVAVEDGFFFGEGVGRVCVYRRGLEWGYCVGQRMFKFTPTE